MRERVGERGGQGGRECKRAVLFSGSHLRCLQQPGPGWAEAGSSVSSTGTAKAKCLACHLLPSRCRELGWNQRQADPRHSDNGHGCPKEWLNWLCHSTCAALCFLRIYLFYLKSKVTHREGQTESEIFLPLVRSPDGRDSQSSAGLELGTRSFSWISPVGARVQGLGPSCAVSGSWMGSGAVETRAGSRMGCQCDRIALPCHHSGPAFAFLASS